MKPRYRGPEPVHDPPPPPAGLSAEVAELWEEAVRTWDFDTLELAKLRAALEQVDVYDACMRIVASEGPVYENPSSGHRRPHPALASAHAALRSARQMFDSLDLPTPTRGRR